MPARKQDTVASETSPTTSISTPDSCNQIVREMKVVIRPSLGFWEYVGNRAQLESDGFIPPGFKWPQGTRHIRWESGAFHFWLHRVHPGGPEWHQRAWKDCDWWCVRCYHLDGLDHEQHAIREKMRDLANEVYRRSAAGKREWGRQWRSYWVAKEDQSFQAFKARLIPERKKPGRNPGANPNGESHA